MTTTIAIVSDTHMPRGARALPDECVRFCSEADLIIHAGDLMETSVLDQFEAMGPPVSAIHGNVDSAALRKQLPAELRLEVEGVNVAVVHDSGPRAGRIRRLRKRFPDHDAVIFGHSHLPLHEESEGFQIFNPGSPTERRRSPFKSMGIARIGGRRIDFELIDLGT